MWDACVNVAAIFACVCVCVWRNFHRYVALWKSCVVGTLWMHNEALNEALACQKTHLTPTENLPIHPDSTHPCPGSSHSCLWPSPVQWPRTLPPSTALAPHTLMMAHPTPWSLSSDFPHTSTPIPGSNRTQSMAPPPVSDSTQHLTPPPVSGSTQPLVPPQVFDSSLPSLLPCLHRSTLTPLATPAMAPPTSRRDRRLCRLSTSRPRLSFSSCFSASSCCSSCTCRGQGQHLRT